MLYMETRKLGSQGLITSALGLGCMTMSHAYGENRDETESILTIHRALDHGVTLLDTAEVYGPLTNEVLVGKAIRGRRDSVVIATKFGIVLGTGASIRMDGSPANAKRAVEGSLQRLGVDVIDLYYLHRKDPNIEIEETIGGMKDLVAAGKVRYLGLSEVGADSLRRAHKVHPITAVQSEYSLWERGIEQSVLPAMRELGVGLVPFSPLGRGYLTGALTQSDMPAGDFRRSLPRFDEANLAANQKLVDLVKTVAQRHNATPARVALAWVLRIAPDAVPIPGTRRRKYLDDNLGAVDIYLTDKDVAELNQLASMAVGDRYPPSFAQAAER
jgi:aryl-alcohol dehydrogenase-like predicted oxidoreductase